MRTQAVEILPESALPIYDVTPGAPYRIVSAVWCYIEEKDRMGCRKRKAKVVWADAEPTTEIRRLTAHEVPFFDDPPGTTVLP